MSMARVPGLIPQKRSDGETINSLAITPFRSSPNRECNHRGILFYQQDDTNKCSRG
jgi:hypothetical protein